jgi:hypothetical protein
MSRNEIFKLNTGEFIQLTHTASGNKMKLEIMIFKESPFKYQKEVNI